MITAGIDVGAENTKSVILGDNRILSYSIIPQGREEILSVTKRALNEAIEKAGIKTGEIEYLVATGVESEYVTFAHERATESSSCSVGANWLLSSTSTIIDMGADKSLVIKCKYGRSFNTVQNDRCASGTGRFLKMAAKLLGVEIEEMGKLSLQFHEDVDIENTCAVFAESEIISLIHLKYHIEDIARAVFKGLAHRIHTMIMKVGFEKDLVMIGGLAKNVGMVKAIEEQVCCNMLVPKEAMIVEALGAALIAAERCNISLKVPHRDKKSRKVP